MEDEDDFLISDTKLKRYWFISRLFDCASTMADMIDDDTSIAVIVSVDGSYRMVHSNDPDAKSLDVSNSECSAYIYSKNQGETVASVIEKALSMAERLRVLYAKAIKKKPFINKADISSGFSDEIASVTSQIRTKSSSMEPMDPNKVPGLTSQEKKFILDSQSIYAIKSVRSRFDIPLSHAKFIVDVHRARMIVDAENELAKDKFDADLYKKTEASSSEEVHEK